MTPRLSRPALLAWSFYALLSAVHVIALSVQATWLADPSKLLLMPALLLAAVASAGHGLFRWPGLLLVLALVFSWLGDGAGTLAPFLPTLPAMLGFFALAHFAYIWLFWNHLAARRLSPAAGLLVLWWAAMVAVVGPHAGTLAVGVAGYGLILGATAAAASRVGRLATWGGLWFLASDSILAFRLFLPDAMPDWTSPAVMLTYTVGQGLLTLAAVRGLGRTANARG